jgi:LacI family transcriptional regulator
VTERGKTRIDGSGASPRRTTIKDVARLAGVSTAAASKVLRNAYGVSPDMRTRVEAAMEELNYRPLASARAMRGRTYTIGILVSDIHNPFFGLLMGGIADTIVASGYEMLVGPGGLSEASQSRMVEAMLDRQMDGLILIAPVAPESVLGALARRVPVVVIGRHGPADAFDTVANDDLLGSRLIVDHLVGLGHERISYLQHGGPVDDDERRPEIVRAAGYADAMRAHGLGEHVDVLVTEWTHAGGERAGEELRARSVRPTAIHAGADVAAYGLLDDLWRADFRVPGELSVVGYDNTPTAALGPVSLTSVDQSGHELGERAASLLLERIEGRAEPVHHLTTPRLVVRRTTAPPA